MEADYSCLLSIMGVALLVSGCSAGRDPSPASNVASDQAQNTTAMDAGAAIADNVASAGSDFRDYGMFEPTLHPFLASAANKLTKPLAYRKALFGYFDDPDMLGQFTAKERAQMPIDGNAFHADADLDHDGAAETYRTGYFQNPDGTTGLFLVVFERGRQIDLWAEPDAAWDILWISTRNSLSLFHCNCPEDGAVSLKHKRLRVKWQSYF